MVAHAHFIEVDDARFEAEVLAFPLPVLVDFTAVWCPPCRVLERNLTEIAPQFSGRVRFVRLDVDQNQASAERYGVRALPTLLVFKDGAVRQQIVGAQPKVKLEELLKRAC